MNNSVKYLILIICILLVQLLASEFVNIHPFVYISVLPLIVIMLPYGLNTSLAMLIACGTGAFADFSYDGIMGLNMAALTAVAYFRKTLIEMIVSKSTRETLIVVNDKSIGKWNFFIYTLLSYIIFISIYVALDNVVFYSLTQTIIRIVMSVALDVAIALLLTKAILVNRFF